MVVLGEALGNLGYELREELRAELPRIFEASGAIFVYATTEPSEALLLGGDTVCMWEGEVLQAGQTPEVYRQPGTLRVAQVFSDPPLNIVEIEKKNGLVQYAGGIQAPAYLFQNDFLPRSRSTIGASPASARLRPGNGSA